MGMGGVDACSWGQSYGVVVQRDVSTYLQSTHILRSCTSASGQIQTASDKIAINCDLSEKSFFLCSSPNSLSLTLSLALSFTHTYTHTRTHPESQPDEIVKGSPTDRQAC
jgi:hypothetical protein